MNKKRIRLRAIVSAVVLMLSCFFAKYDVFAGDILSYIYYYTDTGYHPVQAPSPYNYIKSVNAEDLGIEDLDGINSIFVSDKHVYIGCNGKIVITDHNFNLIRELTSFIYNGKEQEISDITGMWVTDNEELYACEPSKGRILHFGSDWSIKRILGKPEGIIIPENVAYQPLKVAVDSVGRIYVVANNIYEGLVEINPDGTFLRYFGVVEVGYTPIQLFWRRLQTAEQRARSRLWLPVNFSNLTIDGDDFVYATVAGSGDEEPIRKLNAKGRNILRYPVGTGVKPQGDLEYNHYGLRVPAGKSTLSAIDVNDYGLYVVLDTKRSRIFAYDEDGYMLYAFGESGTAEWRFQLPVDVKFMGEDRLLVADRGSESIKVFELNDYGKSIHNAVKYQSQFNYDLAMEEWEKVIDHNPAFQYAYVGVGKALYRRGDYKTARDYFLLGQDVYYYSMAYKKIRQEWAEQYFDLFVWTIVLLVMCVSAYKIVKKFKFQARMEA